MKRSFPPRFYRERIDILTLSVPSKKGAFMHDRARNERRRAYGSRENGVETSSRPVGGSIEGWLGVTSRYIPLAQIQRMHAYTAKTSYQRPSSTRSGYEITHLCVSRAGVLKKAGRTDRLSITLSSCSSKFRRYRHLWGKEKPLDDVAAWWVKYAISRTSNDRIPCWRWVWTL
jgi:hypothetical protein